MQLVWKDAVTPVTRSVFADAIEDAEEQGAAALVIRLDTPGGLLDATRDIVSDFLAADVPIVVWVAPAGARAASAGAFLTMAAHVAAMAPGTNIGAASPVQMGGADPDSGSTLANKMFNDTAAFARSIAERRGRNVAWAERSVRDAISATDQEALKAGVIDLVAKDEDELLRKLDGRRVTLASGEKTLAMTGARVVERPIGTRFRLLSYLANPNVAAILMMLGVWGLFFELQNPGSILPGVVGAVCLILGFYSLQTFPLNLAGGLLLVLALVLFLLETQIPSHGLLAAGGVVATVLGALMLFESPEPALRVSLVVILPLAILTGALFAIAAAMSARTLRRRPTTGREGMIGLRGTAWSDLAPRGTVDVRGEFWNAIAEGPVAKGDEVVVESIDGMVLRVRKV
jgi:membrane-bound serine protease (ClpP class)